MRAHLAFERFVIAVLGIVLLGAAGCGISSEREQATPDVVTAADEKPEPMSSREILYVIEAINQGEAEQAELALQHSVNNEVNEVARLILQDHTASAQAVGELAQGIDADNAESSISEGVKFQAKAFLEDMAGLTGYEFNKTYLEKQVVLHGVALDVVRTQLIPNADEQEVIDYLEDYRDMLELHRERAQQSLREVLKANGQ